MKLFLVLFVGFVPVCFLKKGEGWSLVWVKLHGKVK